jgi:3-methyladenine DNA glycosylase AlkC
MANNNLNVEKTEPFLLKNIYSHAFVAQIAAEICAVFPDFDTSGFLARVFDESWPDLELKQRIRHISHCLRHFLPSDYSDAVAVLVRTVGHMTARDGERLTFEWGVFPDFVEAFGVEDPDTSLPALEILTQLASAEFAIRPFLLRYPARTFAQMQRWAGHASPMVRRLASEGFRPRLPWGMGVPMLKKDPSPILPVLEKLKNDPAETVRRSVANNLNDISKEHPQLVLDIAARWLGHSPETDWVVRHACRGLLKKGDATALAHFGFQKGAVGIGCADLVCDAAVKIGGTLAFSFLVKNTGAQAHHVRLEYAIQYLTQSGKISRKVFKIKELEMKAGDSEAIARRQRFTDFTTRKHFPGTHRLEVLANGAVLAERAFEVV